LLLFWQFKNRVSTKKARSFENPGGKNGNESQPLFFVVLFFSLGPSGYLYILASTKLWAL